jgi:hypothetical protein
VVAPALEQFTPFLIVAEFAGIATNVVTANVAAVSTPKNFLINISLVM